jgi:hypothetical protein
MQKDIAQPYGEIHLCSIWLKIWHIVGNIIGNSFVIGQKSVGHMVWHVVVLSLVMDMGSSTSIDVKASKLIRFRNVVVPFWNRM